MRKPDFYSIMEQAREEDLTPDEAIERWHEALDEYHDAFMRDYENNPIVNAGWAQQDVIDLYRFER